MSFEGKSVTLTGIPAGGWFGEGSLLKNEPRRYDVVALRATRLCPPARLFHWLPDNNIAFNRFLLLQLNERLGQFIGLLETERLLGPEARVARCIAQLFNPFALPAYRCPAADLVERNPAPLTGLSRQRVNQAVRRLEAEALLSVEYGSVTVVSLAGLAGYDADLREVGRGAGGRGRRPRPAARDCRAACCAAGRGAAESAITDRVATGHCSDNCALVPRPAARTTLADGLDPSRRAPASEPVRAGGQYRGVDCTAEGDLADLHDGLDVGVVGHVAHHFGTVRAQRLFACPLADAKVSDAMAT
ncbi:MAG: Crp/Fnr family transcriptional regulator [Burkholderiaceae bacterium]